MESVFAVILEHGVDEEAAGPAHAAADDENVGVYSTGDKAHGPTHVIAEAFYDFQGHLIPFACQVADVLAMEVEVETWKAYLR